MMKKESLKGIEGIYMVVEDLGPELKGLCTRQELKKRAELHLQTSGIRIVKQQEAAQLPGEPYLYLNVAAIPLQDEHYACRIDLEVHQQVALVHDFAGRGHAITWEQGIMTVGGIETLFENIDGLLFDFIHDYLEVNHDE